MWTPARYPLLEFVREAWPIVEQGRKYDHNWHATAICDHLSAVYEGTISNLLVNISPRSGKSLILSVMFHPWVWIMSPGFRFLFFSYSMSLALRDARRARELIRSPWYQRTFGDRVQIDPAFDTMQRYRTLAGGQRFSAAVGSQATGEGAQIRVIDDPHNVEEARHESRADIEAAKDFIMNTLASRVESFADSREIICGQRIAIDDISAEVLANKSHETLVIPNEYVPPEDGVKPVTSLGWSDPREDAGELMWPAHLGRAATERLKKNNRLDYAAQFMQAPQSGKDRLFPRSNWRYFSEWPNPETFEQVLQSWDLRFKEEKDSGSYVSGQVWAKKGASLYLLDRIHERLSFPETQEAIKVMSGKWPHAVGKLIENKANGPAIIQSLRTIVPGLIAVDPARYGGKYERAQAVAMLQHAGNVWLPSPDLAPWVDEFILHFERFPAPPNDDVDAASQAWRRLGVFAPAPDTRYDAARKAQSLERQKMQAARAQAAIPFKLSRTGA